MTNLETHNRLCGAQEALRDLERAVEPLRAHEDPTVVELARLLEDLTTPIWLTLERQRRRFEADEPAATEPQP